jgi:hypothetical protein
MSPATQGMLILTLHGRTFLAPANYPFQVHGQGRTNAADLRVGDRVRDHQGREVSIEIITDIGEQPIVCCLETDAPPGHQAGLLSPGTLLATSDGFKRIDSLLPGDRILPGVADDSGPLRGMYINVG